MNKLMLRGVALFFLLVIAQEVAAKGWVGAEIPCVSGGWELEVGSICDWKNFVGAHYGQGQVIGMRTNTDNTGDDKAYVPVSGNFELKVYWCSLPKNMDTCSKSSGTLLISGGVVRLESSISLRDQLIITGNKTIKSPSQGGYCITLEDVNTGYEYKGNMGYGPDGRGKFCEDAHKLPVEPPKCTLNGGTDLDVQLGQLERGDIPVKSGTSSAMVTKDISVNCEGNIAYNANMKLEFTPISVSNEQVISTSTTGLGVAVLYNGRTVQPGQTFPLSYQPGIHTLKLGFEAVRDPAVAATDLKTGDFTANAVLVFTEQ
ncbi:fimbrial protein [Morganella morganii]|uniref:fimbrial protein n=1 Tax=Morganella morganii TaxID=582 RepID=UPI001646B3F6|nr:fimbrial protein [Morganella morganii]MBC3996180.1 fimbrial protein [Morganella morganii]